MEQKKNYEYYEKQVIDIDEIDGTDIKINPDFYIHKALLKAQDALAKENLKEGFLQYRQFIEHIEVLCSSAKMLGPEYEEQLESFKNSDQYKNLNDKTARSIKLANKKLNLIMSLVFTNKTATFNLKA